MELWSPVDVDGKKIVLRFSTRGGRGARGILDRIFIVPLGDDKKKKITETRQRSIYFRARARACVYVFAKSNNLTALETFRINPL